MKEKGGMDNKSIILTNKIKDAIIFILTLIYFVLTCVVIILNVVAPLTFSLIIFDVLWVIYIVIEYNLFNFPRDPRNDTYLFYIDMILFFLSLIICAQHWEIVKLILQRYFG